MRPISAALRSWILWFLACVVAAWIAFARLDVPVARFFSGVSHHLGLLSAVFGTAVILTVEAAAVLALILSRLMRGRLSRFAETLVIACLASICAYGINDGVLKPIFGVPSPQAFLHGARHAFRLFLGSPGSSFPSGHMVLAGAFTGVFMRLYRASTWPLAVLLLLAAVLLIVGDWHFLSDTIVGAFLGLSAGWLAGEGWAVHSARRP